MKRVLLVTNIFPPQIGGPATFVDHLGRALTSLGHRVTVVCSSERSVEPSDADRPFRVRRIWAPNPLLYELKARALLAAEMARHRHVLVNGLELQAWHVASGLGRRYVLKVVGDTVWETARNTGETVVSIDEFQSLPKKPARLERLAERRRGFLRRARLVITPSDYVRRLVMGWGVEAERVKTIRNGISQEEFAGFEPGRREPGPLEVAFVGRLANWKGVETLLLALEGLEDARAWVAGDGPELPHLIELSRQLGIARRVEFTGRLGEAQVRARLVRAHVLVLTSLYEGLSHTLLEAMASGLPCVVSDRGGNTEVVRTGENGLVIPPQDVAALRAALRRLGDDEELRHRMAKGAKDSSRRFDFSETVRETARAVLEG